MGAHRFSASIVRNRSGGSESSVYNRAGIPDAGSESAAMALLRKLMAIFCFVLSLTGPLVAWDQDKNQAQDKTDEKRLWVLRASGELVEYDPATFAEKAKLRVPAEAFTSPQKLSVNRVGQMMFADPAVLPLADGDLAEAGKAWFWDGRTAKSLALDPARSTSTTGSNLAVTESAPAAYLSADGKHLYWFANQARRLQRDVVDLSTKTTWSSWRTDLTGVRRQDMASMALPDCSCPTGGCEETCPYGQVWVPDDGVGQFFLLTEFVAGQTKPIYKATSIYEESAGKWIAEPLDPPLQRVLDAPNAGAILEAVPDTGCCGWANESDDKTVLRLSGKRVTVFDERDAFKNSDYDVSFYAQSGKLSPGLGAVASTIVASAKPNTPIQISKEGQANPEESQQIRKALLDLPAVEVKSLELESNQEAPRRIAFLPHATLVGWISDKEILIVERNLLVAYNVTSGTRRKSTIHVEDAAHVFLR